MEFINIKGANLKSSRIGLGTWAIGGWMWGGTDEKEAIRTIHAALDQGINLIDTAPIYGYGRSEAIVGEAVRQYGRRESVIIATKVGIDWTNGRIERNSTRERILKEFQDSLRRLQTDYIDIYQVHWPDPLVPIEETAATLGELYKQGKIRAIGVSNYSPEEMDRFRAIAPLASKLDAFARHYLGKRVIHLAVRWLLDQPGVGVALWGARRPEQLAPINEISGWSLLKSDFAAIDAILHAAVRHPVGPEFMAPPARQVLCPA